MTAVLPDAEQRGRTTVDDRVVSRQAAKAVTEVDGVVDGASATADVRGAVITLDVRLAIAYPASLTQTTQRAREHLMGRVEDFTGLEVSRVDITVTAMQPGVTAARRLR
ncbi:Asp23/Gls24 family envelope stress response protein [Kutzneria sp. CA-103260]|uniref:Asp23/Gls24 family envelope stress response protein n=1 Tax=Kutzneria sp. CA-103260 TaxID=2802641 RepID=UPI001BA906F7|nr:Asp23/Gls24 family envelope stress response protein [Kutzneria sp. CA-103260]QUQ68687.1 Asp23/Gls24 family envelope stress response protein [Kutzneria sp. CA-103260]